MMSYRHLSKNLPQKGWVGWVPAGQEGERAADRRQRLPGDPEVLRGGIERLVAQEHLDRPDIDARFEEVGRTTVPVIPRAE